MIRDQAAGLDGISDGKVNGGRRFRDLWASIFRFRMHIATGFKQTFLTANPTAKKLSSILPSKFTLRTIAGGAKVYK